MRIEAVSRQHPRAFAVVEELERAHPARRGAPCPNHESRGGRCSGCALMELEASAQREVKRTLLSEQFGLEVREVEASPSEFDYRWSSKRVAFGSAGSCTLGSYARESHLPSSMTGCLVEHPRLREAFDGLERRARAGAIVPFDERTGRGDLRYVWGKTNGEHVILTLITAARESRAAQLLSALEGPVVGVAHSVQGAASNNVRGSQARRCSGMVELHTSLLGQRVALGALGFLQPNPAVAERAYRALTELTNEHGACPRVLAFDLYAGAGITTGALRETFAQVVPCEAYPESAAALGVPAREVADFLEEALTRGTRPDLVVANPPRKGLGARVCALLSALAAPELRIMSCGPEGLARDLALLAPRYRLISLRAFDTLPQTPHVELVAHLHLQGPSDSGSCLRA